MKGKKGKCGCKKVPAHMRDRETGEPLTEGQAVEAGQAVTDAAGELVAAPGFVPTVNQVAVMATEEKPKTNYQTLGAGVVLGFLVCLFVGGR